MKTPASAEHFDSMSAAVANGCSALYSAVFKVALPDVTRFLQVAQWCAQCSKTDTEVKFRHGQEP